MVKGSTPVVAFGDPEVARVATLGINPSIREFRTPRGWLDGPQRRLATLKSLDATRTENLSDKQVAQVVADCANYFQRNPYLQWFTPLDIVLQKGLGVSYFDQTACHLDLVQWATDPVWSKIPDRQARRQLLDDGVEHLRAQLHKSVVDTVVVNGDAVWKQLIATDSVSVTHEESLAFGNQQSTTKLRVAKGSGVRFFGWTLNLQGTFGVRGLDRESLAAWLKEAARPADSDAYVVRSVLRSRREFTTVLANWEANSDAPTLGDVGSYGRRWVLRLACGDGRFVSLNADTTRTAVQQYLHVERTVADGPLWYVKSNRNGRINRVDFTTSGPPTAGWYAYLTSEASSEGPL